MDRNPYQELAGLLSEKPKLPPGYRIGHVLGLSPMRLDVAGTVQEGNILVNAELLSGAGRMAGLSGHMTITGTDESVTGTASATALKLTWAGAGIAVGDQVLLLSGDDQIFILVCKVVKA